MLEGDAHNPESLGDIVICVPKAVRQCKRFKSTPANEVLRLLIHGMLHLFGYEHVAVSKSRVEEMRSVENELLERYSVKQRR